jgi:hypothetical protein
MAELKQVKKKYAKERRNRETNLREPVRYGMSSLQKNNPSFQALFCPHKEQNAIAILSECQSGLKDIEEVTSSKPFCLMTSDGSLFQGIDFDGNNVWVSFQSFIYWVRKIGVFVI